MSKDTSIETVVKQEVLSDSDEQPKSPPPFKPLLLPDSQGIKNKNGATKIGVTMPTKAAVSPRLSPSGDVVEQSRMIYKVKRFLSTLVQFGTDISPETGERVKDLIFNLVSGSLTVSDFHSVLQEVTNFPLRPFVLPFLSANIPLLSRDVTGLATLANQTPYQYLRANQHLLLETPAGGSELNDYFHADRSHIKRRSSSETSAEDVKRPRSSIGGGSSRPPRQQHWVYPQPWSGARSAEHFLETQSQSNGGASQDDEWRNIHVMLNCILGMVDKTKRALTILQQRNGGPIADIPTTRPVGELLAATIRSTEEKVVEVRRRAEEAVHEVKRVAMTELHRAVAMAERRALDSVASERLKMERLLLEATRAGGKDKTVCWNCAREASETCSGCNLARYCSLACQHKDWEVHHRVCGAAKKEPEEKAPSPVNVEA